MEGTLQSIYALVTLYGVKVIAAIAIFIIGRWVAKGLRSLTKKVMDKKNVDPTITGFVGNLTYMALLVFVIIAALGQLGIQTTSFIAILGAAGLAIAASAVWRLVPLLGRVRLVSLVSAVSSFCIISLGCFLD